MAKDKDHNVPEPELVSSALDVLEAELPEDDDPLLDEDDVAIPSDLKFTTKQKDPDAEPEAVEWLTLDLDGYPIRMRKPASGAFSMILASISKASTQADRTNAILQFVYASADPGSQIVLNNRILDPEDPFDIDMLGNIVSRLLEKWAPASRSQRRAAARKGRR